LNLIIIIKLIDGKVLDWQAQGPVFDTGCVELCYEVVWCSPSSKRHE